MFLIQILSPMLNTFHLVLSYPQFLRNHPENNPQKKLRKSTVLLGFPLVSHSLDASLLIHNV